MATKIGVIKEFFGTEKPVTNQELIALRKADPKGWDEIAQDCAKALGQELDN